MKNNKGEALTALAIILVFTAFSAMTFAIGKVEGAKKCEAVHASK